MIYKSLYKEIILGKYTKKIEKKIWVMHFVLQWFMYTVLIDMNKKKNKQNMNLLMKKNKAFMNLSIKKQTKKNLLVNLQNEIQLVIITSSDRSFPIQS